MASTKRALTVLQALFADNVTGTISPQDLRDFLVSAYPGSDITLATDHTVNGKTGTFTNGNSGSVNFGDVCYIAADGDMEFADADDVATMPGVYMALDTIVAGASGEWLRTGWVRDDSWNWTVGGLIYISTTGTTGNTLTQTPVSGEDDQLQIVGIATHADRMDFNPNLMLITIAAP